MENELNNFVFLSEKEREELISNNIISHQIKETNPTNEHNSVQKLHHENLSKENLNNTLEYDSEGNES